LYVDIDEVTLTICNCCPATFLLLELGLFPSAPIHPMLAVNLDLLDFTSTVFKVEQPNIHGWTNSLQRFLQKWGYVLDGDV
jgi:CxC1 like cysteine cluster associated with KDZ transposases